MSTVNRELQPQLRYNMIWALHSQSPPSFLALSCLTHWRMWGSRVQGSPSWPISWRERCPEHWSMSPVLGGGRWGSVLLMTQSNECRLGAGHCWLQEAPWTASLTEWVWLEVRGAIAAGAPASNILPGGPRWRHIWQMDSFSRAVPGGSGLWCRLMAGLPAHHHARFFICMASPELRQLPVDNEAMFTWMDEPGYQRHTSASTHTNTQTSTLTVLR